MGEIVNFMFTPGNVDDREPLKVAHFTEELYGKLVGDRGYISKDLFCKLFIDGIQLITKLKNRLHTKSCKNVNASTGETGMSGVITLSIGKNSRSLFAVFELPDEDRPCR